MISAVVITKNEEANIERCLKSVKWCDEIIIIDDYSTDNTSEIAKKLGGKLYERELNGDFSAQRNFGLSKAKGEWVLFVDADEVVSEDLKTEILKVVQGSSSDGFYIRRKDFMWGKEIKHGESGNIDLLRLAKKDVESWQGKVHERWIVNNKVGKLKNPLLHCPHPTTNEFLKKINFYTDIRAKELYGQGVKSNFLSIIFHTKAKFIQNYLVKLGFLDGIRGLILALIMSLHSFMVRGKLWLLWQKK